MLHVLFGFISYLAFTLFPVAAFCETIAEKPGVCDPAGDSAFSLLQLSSVSRHDKSEHCTDLLNRGSHFAVQVNVGTPAQSFELVADTGSDAIIVTSCLCVAQGFCSPDDKCFRGTNRSSTFALSSVERGTGDHSPAVHPLGVDMTFGSGTVKSVVATDVVEVAGVKTVMHDGVLLMVDRRALKIAGPFEGILGLGIQKKHVSSNAAPASRVESEAELKSVNLVQSADNPRPSGISPRLMHYESKLFFNEAKVDRFSICFNDQDKPGTLRLNVPPSDNALPAIGQVHWGLGLSGISIGSNAETAAKITVCDKTMGDQQTPCGAIPDSGTTLLMGPKEHVEAIFESICDNWERCRDARKGPMSNLTKSHAFQMLLFDCGSWLTDDTGINEVPSIFLNLGSPGHEQKVELTAWSYITETMQPVYEQVTKHLYGILPVKLTIPTDKVHKVCSPSFGVQDYNTKENGPVWILGTPLFYQYTVGYSMSGRSISFMTGKCSGCSGSDDGSKATLLSSSNEVKADRTNNFRRIRKVETAPRTPWYDTTLPL